MLKHLCVAVVAVCFVAQAAMAADNARGKNFATFRVGGIEVVALLDAVGVNEGKVDLLIGAGEDDLKRAAEDGALKTSINAFVVKLNGKTILFDTGLPIAQSGGIMPALARAGLAPDQIDAVVITHFHFDHVGGLVHRGAKVYPNAELFVPRVEVNKWSDPGTDFLLTYNVRTNAFEDGAEILPGVTAMAAYGHTPGHTIFMLESEGKKLLVIGDLIHLPGVQLVNPDVAVTYDTNPSRAVASRKRVFAKAAAEQLPVASMHIPFPGVGVLSADGAGYTFKELDAE